MNQLAPVILSRAPALVVASGARASYRFLEFFTAQIRNPHTRRAYARAATEFFDWLEAQGVTQLAAIESMHVATYTEQLSLARSAPTAKLRLAALRCLFDWMVIGQIMPTNPAAAVRGPRHIVRRGKTPVLDPAEARQLLDAIDIATVIGLRDRALIGLMVYSFARIGAAIGMRGEDVYTQNRRLWVRLQEKGGKQPPCRATTISNPTCTSRQRAAPAAIAASFNPASCLLSSSFRFRRKRLTVSKAILEIWKHLKSSSPRILASGSHLAAGTTASAVMTVSDHALAQPAAAARVRGPLVWLDMDQKELDDAYDQSVYAPNMQQVRMRIQRNSELVRERLGIPKRLAYGPTSIETLDLYATKAVGAPVNVFVHGGAWRAGVAKDNAGQAEMLVNAGAHLAVLDFNNVIETGGDLMTMADQIRRGVAWVCKNARSFGGDPERVYISGHSSGGHWVGVLLTTDWQKDFGMPPTMIKGGVAGSGMFDLKPVRLSARSNYVKFTDEAEETLSSQRHLDKLMAPVALVYGTAETPEFQRQSRDFAAAVKAAGKPVTLSVMEGYNHFEVSEQLANPYSLFGRAVLEQMKLRPV